MERSIMSEKRSVGLDLLKIAACFSVVVLHVASGIATENTGYTISHALYYTAGLAVPMFFMVNGNLLLNRPSIDYRYIIKKVLRILLVVFTWNVLFAVAVFVVERKITNPVVTSLENLLSIGHFAQFWFFGALIILYLVLPLLHRYFSKMIPALIMTGFFILLSLIVDAVNIVRCAQGNPTLDGHVYQTFRLWTWLAYYCLGGLLGKEQIKEFVLKHLRVPAKYLLFVISLLVINIYQYHMGLLYKNQYAEQFYVNIFMFVYVISLFILIYNRNFKHSKIIGFVGGNIMGIYIVHTSVIGLIMRFYDFGTPLANTCLIFIVFTVSLAASVIIGKIPLANKIIKIS